MQLQKLDKFTHIKHLRKWYGAQSRVWQVAIGAVGVILLTLVVTLIVRSLTIARLSRQQSNQVPLIKITDGADGIIYRATQLQQADNNTEAINTLKVFAEDESVPTVERYEVYLDLGRAYARDDSYEQSLAAYQAAKTLPGVATDDFRPALGIATAAFRLENYSLAIENYELVVKTLRANPDADTESESVISQAEKQLSIARDRQAEAN